LDLGQPILSGATACAKPFIITTNRDDDNEEGQRFELFHKHNQETSDITGMDENVGDYP
jgi:hypothetical protein